MVRENTTDWKINLTMIYFEKSQNLKIFKSIETRNQILHYRLFSKLFFGKFFAALRFLFCFLLLQISYQKLLFPLALLKVLEIANLIIN